MTLSLSREPRLYAASKPKNAENPHQLWISKKVNVYAALETFFNSIGYRFTRFYQDPRF